MQRYPYSIEITELGKHSCDLDEALRDSTAVQRSTRLGGWRWTTLQLLLSPPAEPECGKQRQPTMGGPDYFSSWFRQGLDAWTGP